MYCKLSTIFSLFMFYSLSSIAFASFTAWPCLVAGSIFFAMSILNLVRYFGCCNDKKEGGDAAVAAK